MGLATNLEQDESDQFGQFRVGADGSMRTWLAPDINLLLARTTETDTRTYSYNIPAAILRAWPVAAGDSNEATIFIGQGNGSSWIQIIGPGGSFITDYQVINTTEFDRFLLHTTLETSLQATAIADGYGLKQAVDTAVFAAPARVDKDNLILGYLDIDNDDLRLDVNWGLGEATSLTLPVDSEGTGATTIALGLMTHMLSFFGPETIKVEIPEGTRTWLRFQQGDLTAHVARPRPFDRELTRITECIESLFGEDAAQRDENGDFRLTRYGPPIYARFIPQTPARLTLSAEVLQGVPESFAVLKELNDLNTGQSFSRVTWQNGRIIASSELVARTLDVAELEASFDAIRTTAAEIAPLIQALYGGVDITPSEDSRWEAYLDAVVSIETRPNRWQNLTGSDALRLWNLPPELWVITAENPFGRMRSMEQNEEAMANLAATIISAGGPVMRAIGSSPDGTYQESSFATWGLSEEVIMQIARAFDQESIFRLTAYDVEVVGVSINHRVSKSRQPSINP